MEPWLELKGAKMKETPHGGKDRENLPVSTRLTDSITHSWGSNIIYLQFRCCGICEEAAGSVA